MGFFYGPTHYVSSQVEMEIKTNFKITGIYQFLYLQWKDEPIYPNYDLLEK